MGSQKTNEDQIGAAGTRGVSRRRWWVLRLVTMLLASVLAVGICEGLLWIIAPIPYHEWMVWVADGHIGGRALPYQVFKTADGHEVRINKDGFRGPDYTYEKPGGTLRIVVFGGSAAFCYHAAGRENTWPTALELKLKVRLRMPVEVVNLALPGFSSFKSKINYLCYGRAFHPDAIIVYHTWNDMQRFRAQETTPYIPQPVSRNKPLWQLIARQTQLGRRARHFLWTAKGRYLEGRLEEVHPGADRAVGPKPFALERRNFEDFVLLAENDGVLPVLATQALLASAENLDDPEVRLAMAVPCGLMQMTLPVLVVAQDEISAIIEEVAREHGAVFLDGYNAVPHDLQHLCDNVHLHDVGALLLAEKFADGLLGNPRFQELAERVRNEAASPPGDSIEPPGSKG